ncbi:hypothetical protein FRX31_034927 [Thalictrum thalictroides]|uniref:Cell differentiation protein rcd1 n=1 Tax=Thalictrum thalictroides TaxID=46969 RepID=A0A7J6USC2_THATH|nr:hypothetical protein FRX31_034927 [Thalictrum thalictroides]
MIETCRVSIEVGSELCKVVRMICIAVVPHSFSLDFRGEATSSIYAFQKHCPYTSDATIGIHILKTILQNQAGLSYICSPQRGNYKLLLKLMKTLGHMVAVLARKQHYSPRLLFHIIGCYILLCGDMRGLRVVKKSLPHHFTKSLPYHITDKFFQETKEEHPNIRELVEQLLLTVEAH